MINIWKCLVYSFAANLLLCVMLEKNPSGKPKETYGKDFVYKMEKMKWKKYFYVKIQMGRNEHLKETSPTISIRGSEWCVYNLSGRLAEDEDYKYWKGKGLERDISPSPPLPRLNILWIFCRNSHTCAILMHIKIYYLYRHFMLNILLFYTQYIIW